MTEWQQAWAEPRGSAGKWRMAMYFLPVVTPAPCFQTLFWSRSCRVVTSTRVSRHRCTQRGRRGNREQYWHKEVARDLNFARYTLRAPNSVNIIAIPENPLRIRDSVRGPWIPLKRINSVKTAALVYCYHDRLGVIDFGDTFCEKNPTKNRLEFRYIRQGCRQ